MQRTFCRCLVVCLLAATAGCATNGASRDDPLENYNRAMTRFNLQVDEWVLAPVARGYRAVVPGPVRGGIGNFFRNLGEPFVLVNDLLQGKPGAAGRDAGRFLINTTLGFAGLADVATDLGIERNDEDFGQTLAVWRVPPGPHLVLPLVGPSNIRDGFGVATGLVYGSPIRPEDGDAQLGLRAVDVVDTRARFLGTEKMIALQPDPYLFLRESYRQRREVQIRDGVMPDDGDTEDMFLDELLQDD